MDQDAFRALLNAPSTSDTPLRSNKFNSRSLALGSRITNNSTNRSNPSGSSYKPSSLKPRKLTPKASEGKSKDGDRTARSGYRDRASERRQGLDGDFAEAEHLLKNFQARVAAADSQVDKDTLEQQTKYLGGDERHTILVKGLDHALLERRKAELSQGGKLGQVTDEDLETAYEQNAKQSSSVRPNSSNTISSTNSSSRKNRDELLAQLKNSRNQQPPDLVVVEKLKAVGKFKPIGSTGADPNSQELERKEHKRRKAEKKKKKKALKAEHAATSSSSTLDPSMHNTALLVDSQVDKRLSTKESIKRGEHQDFVVEIENPPSEKSRTTASTPSALAPWGTQLKGPVQTNETVQDDDLDIFGDAGEYKGLDEESSGEEDKDRNFQTSEAHGGNGLGSMQATKKRKTYFEDDEVESDLNVEDVKKQEAMESSHKKHSESLRRNNMRMEPPDQESFDEDNNLESNQIPRLTKLEGLSGSADIKSILAVDAIQEKEEKRKAKKQKNKSEKIMTDQDRLNRDYLEMERYLKQKKNPDQSYQLPITNHPET